MVRGVVTRVRAIRALALIALVSIVALPVTVAAFTNAERDIRIGSQTAVLQPTLDGHATLSAGPFIPAMRIPADSPGPIGVKITIDDSPLTNFEQIVAQNAAIASQPAGEVAAVKAEVVALLWWALVRGLAAGVTVALVAVSVWLLLGQQRRAELRASWPPKGRTLVTALVFAALLLASTALWWPRADSPTARNWVAFTDEFGPLPEGLGLANVEVARGAAATGNRAILEGALKTYQESRVFYDRLAERAQTATLRQPSEDETVALVVTDRHNNIGMDPVARIIADRAGASFVIDLGDDTSNGASWEEFSINSLRSAFEGWPIVAVAGNHDQGDHIKEHMKRRGFIVAEGEPVEVEGVTFLGDSDPRSSGLTAGYSGNEDDNIAAVSEQSQRLAEVACDDEEVSVLIVHSMASARQTNDRGCVDLSLAGHLHRQVGPEQHTGDVGTTTALTIGSTGGAVYAFALGTKLRRDAQVAAVTFAEGRPVGVQVVTFKPGGAIEVGDFAAFGGAAN